MLTYQDEPSGFRLGRADLVAVSFRLTLPTFTGEGAARATQTITHTLSEVKGVLERLADEVLREYTESRDPHRRFRHRPYEGTLVYTLRFCSEHYLSFAARLTIRRGGREVGVFPFGETFRRSDGRSLPLFCFADRQARRALGTREYFLDETGKVCAPS